MPKLTPQQIHSINSQADIVALLRARGIVLHKQTGNRLLQGVCPFQPAEPHALTVNAARKRYACKVCGVDGGALEFLQAFDGISQRHAYEILNVRGAAYHCVPGHPCRKSTVRRLASFISPDAPAEALIERVVQYYHERLLVTPTALAYLAALGLGELSAIRQLRLGISDRTLGLHLPDRRRVNGAAIRKRLENAGIYRCSGHEHLTGALIVPTLARGDSKGAGPRIAALYGRRIGSKLRPGVARDLFLDAGGGAIWNQDAITETNPQTLILCNEPLDALIFWGNGFRHVTFHHGSQGLTQDALAILRTLSGHSQADGGRNGGLLHRVYLAYPNSESGNAFANSDAGKLLALGVEVHRCIWPRDKTLQEHIEHKRGGNSTETALQGILNTARWLDPCALRSAAPATQPLATLAPARQMPAKQLAMPAAPPPAAKLTAHAGAHARHFGASVFVEQEDGALLLTLQSRQYRIKPPFDIQLGGMCRVALMLTSGSDIHLDKLDLARDSERRRYAQRAAEETGIDCQQVQRDLSQILLALEQHPKADTAAASAEPAASSPPPMPAGQYQQALALLQDPDLIASISAACEQCGLVGEPINRIAAYLACTSRILEHPLAVIIQSSSAAGKSTLMETILGMMPDEDLVRYSAMTGQSVFYLGKTDLQHKILAIAEEQGMRKASYALKLLQSEGSVSIATTGKDPRTGRIQTQDYHVQGPVMIFLTTTAAGIDDELLSRCLVITADESPGQTARIHARQRQEHTLHGRRQRQQRSSLLCTLRNAQRLLKPLEVINPWAKQLSFNHTALHSRRDHQKYLTLIDTIALLHQYQRPVHSFRPAPSGISEPTAPGKSEYILVQIEDIELANQLAPALLGPTNRTLPPRSRQVLDAIRQYIASPVSGASTVTFSRRQIRDLLGWSTTQTRMHLERLCAKGLIQISETRPGHPVHYRLQEETPRTGNPFGLVDPSELRTPDPLPPPPSGCRGVSKPTPTPLTVLSSET